MSYKVAIETFGCRLNQAESSIFVRQFTDRGYEWVAASERADLCIINTCTLTSQATSKCRRLIRSIIRRNPDACIAAVGCYAQTGTDDLREIEGLDYIVGTSDKMRLHEIIPSPAKLPAPMVVRHRAARERFEIDTAGFYPVHTRANLKVQEGCNFVCSFCIVPKSRGPARSRRFEDIIREARILGSEGHRELIITGINVGTYEDRGRTLADVVDALHELDDLDRIRLSSIEPTTIEPRLIDRMVEGGKVCPYLHIPLQSGDDGILEKMRRRYTSREFRKFIDYVLERVPDIGLGTDVIVGFPGEDEDAFRNTRRLVEDMPFNNIHVFSFSSREGTGAHRMNDAVLGNVIAERSKLFHRLADRKKRQFYERQCGEVLRVLFEERNADGRFVGFTDNYVKVGVETDRDLCNRIEDVRVMGVTDQGAHRPPLAVGALLTGRESTLL
jgi:threonylcarbamoyladenosine tRNA methylthiotransferase MtaB